MISDLKEVTKGNFHVERYVILLFDEMEVKSNLVFDKHRGEVKGYLDIGCIENDVSPLGREILLPGNACSSILLTGCCDKFKIQPCIFFNWRHHIDTTDGIVLGGCGHFRI